MNFKIKFEKYEFIKQKIKVLNYQVLVKRILSDLGKIMIIINYLRSITIIEI